MMLEINGLNQFYGGSHILWDVSLTVPRGSCTVLMGRNGMGKSTLLRCIMGITPVASGAVTWDSTGLLGRPASDRARMRIGYVPQGREIFSQLTVEENLRTGLGARHDGATKVPGHIYEMFPVLKQMLRRRGGDLSGGQQQQLAIGRALAMGPKLLILDEPTEGIQPSIIKDIERAIRTLASTGELAILLVEQYYDFARSLADQYLVMERGVIIARGAGADMDRDDVRGMLAV